MKRMYSHPFDPERRKENDQSKRIYPNIDGKKLDMGYYCNKHIPMIQQMLRAACKRMAVEQGLGGAEPGSRASYIYKENFLALPP